MPRPPFESFEWSRSKLFWNQYLPREKDCRWTNTACSIENKTQYDRGAIEIECSSLRQESGSDRIARVVATIKPRFSILDDIEMRHALEYILLTSLLMVLKTRRMGAAAEEPVPEFQNKGTSSKIEFLYSKISLRENLRYHRTSFYY